MSLASEVSKGKHYVGLIQAVEDWQDLQVRDLMFVTVCLSFCFHPQLFHSPCPPVSLLFAIVYWLCSLVQGWWLIDKFKWAQFEYMAVIPVSSWALRKGFWPWFISLLIFFFLTFILEYSQLTRLWSFHVDCKGTQPYMYMYPFSPKPPSHPGCHITLSRVLCAIQ